MKGYDVSQSGKKGPLKMVHNPLQNDTAGGINS